MLRVSGCLLLTLISAEAWAQWVPTVEAPAELPPAKPDETAGPAASPAAAEPDAAQTPPATTHPEGESESLERPPAHYYLERAQPPGPDGRSALGTPPVYPPPQPIFEPPPPPPAPRPRHRAPRNALWLGVRLGWFFPFGDLWTSQVGNGLLIARSFSDYASSGPMAELNLGARLSRYYNLFMLWERSQLGTGDLEGDQHGGQKGGDSDFYAVGFRANSNPDRIGVAVEVALGYRRFRARWEDETELRFTDGFLEARMGIGAEIRLTPRLSLSPMLSLGAGSFGDIERATTENTRYQEPSFDYRAVHHFAALAIGGHYEFFASP